LELKLVTIMLLGTAKLLSVVPVGLTWSRKMGEVTPKLPSILLLLKMLLALLVEAYKPLSVALPAHAPDAAVLALAGQTGGNAWPTTTVLASPV
jgi:hypothetical protein